MRNGNVVSFGTGRPFPPPHHADALSFCRRKKRKEGGGLDCWVVESTGDYGCDWALGYTMAREYLEYIGAYPTTGNSTLLASIVKSMMEHARVKEHGLGGAELAFLRGINNLAMFAANGVERGRLPEEVLTIACRTQA